jgi:hypothetical protein
LNDVSLCQVPLLQIEQDLALSSVWHLKYQMSTQKLGFVTLPPINAGRNHGGANPGQINGIITNRTNAQQLIYRSVPPKNSGESFSDMFGGSPTNNRF